MSNNSQASLPAYLADAVRCSTADVLRKVITEEHAAQKLTVDRLKALFVRASDIYRVTDEFLKLDPAGPRSNIRPGILANEEIRGALFQGLSDWQHAQQLNATPDQVRKHLEFTHQLVGEAEELAKMSDSCLDALREELAS